MVNKTMEQLSDELFDYLKNRGISANGQNNYRYILNVMTKYCTQHNNGYYSDKVIADCISARYGIDDITEYNGKKDNYKLKICRVVKILADLNACNDPQNRYIEKSSSLSIPEFNTVLESFYQYHLRHGYSKLGADAYRHYAERFLEFCEKSEVKCFSEITSSTVNGYVMSLAGFAKATVKGRLGGVRIFLRYLYTEKYITTNLGDDIIPLKVKGQLRIPSVWQHDEVLRLLSVIDRGNPSGKRDYAMILMVARLGIRIGDLCRLQFQNIDWRNNRIEFTQGKTQYKIALPLLKDVGWALINYIQNGRPNIDTPYIFVTHVVPFKPFDESNHHSRMIKKYMQLAHLPYTRTKKCGMHALRHTLATTMLENHEDYSNISAALGHRSEDSASVYLKTSVELLRECALEIPEVSE